MFKKLLLFMQIIISGVYGYSGWGSHVPALLTAILHTQGPVLEMGCGHWSTPILHAVCGAQGRFLLSAESDEAWLNLVRSNGFECSWHHFVFVADAMKKPENWNTIGNNQRWGCVFIDHAPGERRVADIARMRSLADVLVVHDTDAPSYGYEPVLSSFKYRYDYTVYLPQTTVVSDTVDVCAFFVNDPEKSSKMECNTCTPVKLLDVSTIELAGEEWCAMAMALRGFDV